MTKTGETIKKICTKCGDDLPLSEYHKMKAGKYGRRSTCKACNKIYRKAYTSTEEFKESHRKRVTEWRKANPKRVAQQQRKSRQKHKDKHNMTRLLKYHNDPEYRARKDAKDKEYRKSEKGQAMLNKPKNKANAIERSRVRRSVKMFREHDNKRNSQWGRDNRPHLREWHRRQTEALTDGYIRSQLTRTGFHSDSITPELIEFKRGILKLKRELYGYMESGNKRRK